MSYDTEIQIELKKKERRQSLINRSLEKVFMYPSGSPERWRNALRVLCEVRPAAKVIFEQTAEFAEVKRKQFGAHNKFGLLEDKSAGQRYSLSMPPYLMQLLKMADPEYFIGKGARSLGSPTHLNKMRLAFPELWVPEAI